MPKETAAGRRNGKKKDHEKDGENLKTGKQG